MRGPRFIDITAVCSEEKTRLIRTFLECEVFSVQKKTGFFCEPVDVLLKTRRKTLDIPFLEINETGLLAAGAAALALEGIHKEGRNALRATRNVNTRKSLRVAR